MLLGPAHVDPVAAVGEHVLNPLLWLHQFALLVDHDSGKRFRLCDLAAVGCKLAGEQLEQRRLAGAVGADDTDPVAALNAQREVADD